MSPTRAADPSNVTTTQQLYQHGDIDLQRAALNSAAEQLFGVDARDHVQPGADSSALLSKQLSPVENAISHEEAETNENRRLPEVETAGFLGGSGGARTHDILLKSLTQDTYVDVPTPVLRRLHTRTIMRIRGRVAVITAVKTVASPVPSTATLEALRVARDACQLAITEQLRRRSFPLNLIPSTPDSSQEDAA